MAKVMSWALFQLQLALLFPGGSLTTLAAPASHTSIYASASAPVTCVWGFATGALALSCVDLLLCILQASCGCCATWMHRLARQGAQCTC
jgi:hypothetical protein